VGSNERRERAKEETRQRILDAARELFASEGAEAVTMRRIAERIEYTPTTIYVHFKDKLALLRELMQSDLQVFAAHFASVAAVADPIERLSAMGRAYVDFAMTHPNHYRLLFITTLPVTKTELAPAAGTGTPEEDAYAMLEAVVGAALASGRLRPEHTDLQLLCQTVWSCMHGVASLAISMRCHGEFQWRPLEDITATTLRCLVRGMVRDDDPYLLEHGAHP
jgi:AcrR family transcriptional regulator